ncbi:MAG: LysR family transcriptional regulator [Rhodobacteraceae bacterium]|nr:LysR family transcriptional regulator [Paracoccaceae bacterium]
MPVNPPRPRGPSLNALRAFEASARLGGFSAAANELCISPAAVAQHIKTLEEWAGADLFERQSRGVKLTALGQGIAFDFHKAFDQLGLATLTLRRRAMPDQIRIAALPSIAQLWLPRRLRKIRQAFPDLAISVTALEVAPNLKREPFDMAIFYHPLPLGKNLTFLADDFLYPVCSPELAKTLQRPEDLADVTLLDDDQWLDDWPDWIAQAAPNLAPDISIGRRRAEYSLYALAIEEAKSGAGVAMARHSLVADQMANGDLVAPFSHTIACRTALAVTVPNAAQMPVLLSQLIDLLQKDASDALEIADKT